jgi:pimeloyl-ACP methyl ester carboxylesterase
MLGFERLSWRGVGGEVEAFGTAALSLPLRWLLPDARLDPVRPSETPVVFVHGLLGDPTNFLTLRRALATGGMRAFASFAYRPRLDHQRLAPRLGSMIQGVLAATGARQVDVVGHSMGGLVARYLVESGGGHLVRRLVTLAAPYYTARFPRNELAIFAAEDPLVVPPDPLRGPRGQVRVVPDCGHVALLYHPTVLGEVARYLGRPAWVVGPVSPSLEREAA